MNKKIQLKLIVNSVSNEKGISEDIIFNAIEEAIVYTTTKKYGIFNIKTKINKNNGTYKTYIVYEVIKDNLKNIVNPSIEIPINYAKKTNPNIKIGDKIEKEIKSINFGRIDAQIAKYVIINKIKLAEKNIIMKEFSEKKGKLISGIVKKINKDEIILDLGNNAEGLLKKKDQLPKDIFKLGDKVKAFFTEISKNPTGPEILLTRTSDKMIIELFKIEVPEINENIIEIVGAVRDPGIKAKISIKTNDGRLDPIGACIGIRGSRIQAISNELNGEKIDIILWDPDPIKYVINALSPTEISSIEIDEETRSMNIAVHEDFLSRTIGKNGINIKLASKLTHWELNIISNDEANKKIKTEIDYLESFFIKNLNINSHIANLLISNGFSSLEELAYMPLKELSEIKGIEEKIIKQIKIAAAKTLEKNKINKT
ncbi:MAG TPA: transcription termination factor NusA [Candidatus Azoamicus sp. OHIO1]